MLKSISKIENVLNRIRCRLARYKGLREPIENKKIVADCKIKLNTVPIQ
ncbi:hypothetical protein BBD26_1101 [Lactobacillus delbrueckii subsp. bulgaricus]|nr:hypothetical protein BBD26_1101 [Lactobacillus delbrueckii subsp. bulgaricus]